jgi:23S rRNA pseudouridine1911/1915/1917 synthase
VPPGRALRIDRLIADSVPGLSRHRAQSMIAEGRIRVDGRRCRKGDAISGGIDVEVAIEDLAAALVPEPDPRVPVLYEDEWLVALDKPAGRPGHALRPEDTGTVANFLAAVYPETASVGSNPLEHGLAHRLDTDTSGVLLAARTSAAWRHLRAQFRERSVGKRYLAIVDGKVTGPGESREPIDDRRGSPQVRVVSGSGRGRKAITCWRPLVVGAEHTLLEVEIETGVRHQIRAHLAAAGHPVVGDRAYGHGGESAARQMLHAASIEITHPQSGDRARIASAPPPDFLECLTRLFGDPHSDPSMLLLKV